MHLTSTARVNLYIVIQLFDIDNKVFFRLQQTILKILKNLLQVKHDILIVRICLADRIADHMLGLKEAQLQHSTLFVNNTGFFVKPLCNHPR